jgi:hypothetical protein
LKNILHFADTRRLQQHSWDFLGSHGRCCSPRWQAKSTWLALQGPGRIAVQSVFERPEQVGSVRRSSPATQQAW